MPTAIAPARTNAAADSAVTPPVGIRGMSGNGPRQLAHGVGPGDRGREQLDRGRPRPPRREHLRRRQGARERRDPALGGPRDQHRVRVGHHQEPRAGLDGALGGLRGEHRAGPDDEWSAADVARNRRDRLERVVLRIVEGQLERPDAARHQPVGDRLDPVAGEPPPDGDDAACDEARREVGPLRD